MGKFTRHVKKTVAVLIVVSLVLMEASHALHAQHLFVSPHGSDRGSGLDSLHALATLEKAVEKARSLKIDGNETGQTVTVFLLGGEYLLKTPVVIGPDPAGPSARSITIKPYPGNKVIFSGGVKITGWKKGPNGLWVAPVPRIKNIPIDFKQLFVNGERRFVARSPNHGFYRVAAFPGRDTLVAYNTPGNRFGYAKGDLNPDWHNLKDIEVVVYHFWTDTHLHLQSIDEKSRIVTFREKAGKVFTDDFTHQGARYIVTGVFEGLDSPGEWYLDKKSGQISYKPMPGEDMHEINAWAPVASALLSLTGDPLNEKYVTHIHFENLHFQCAKAMLPPAGTNNPQAASSLPAAIRMRGARDCSFTHCEIKNVGGYAFSILDGCLNDRISSNKIMHVGAGGIRVNGGDDQDNPLLRTGRNLISDNVLDHYGDLYASGVGVLLMQTFANRVVHNRISHGYYTGISVGWEWGYQRSISWNNQIAFNDISHIGQGLLSDMGGIYTLGVSPGTVVRNNLIHDIQSHTYGGWGIYNDEGSTHLLIENNIVYNTKFAGYNIHYAKEIMVRNNIFALGKLQQLSRSKMEAHKSVFFENNIVYWKSGVLLDHHWEDKPYLFHFSPNGKQGDRIVQQTFDMDWNIYFNPEMPVDSVQFNGHTWQAWQQLGKDRHSLYRDPLFIDPEKYDFRLRPNSPAFKLGFLPIDRNSIGPRGTAGPIPGRIEDPSDR